MKPNEIFGLFKPLARIKFIKRKGWEGRGLEADSITAHSFDAVHIGWYLALEEGYRPEKVKDMLAVHDLVMAYMDDVTPSSGRYEEKKGLEEKATEKLIGDLPKKTASVYKKLIEEFRLQTTPEALLSREADKLATLLQGDSYEEKTGRSDILDEFLTTYFSVFKSKTGKEIFKIIKKRHEERKTS